MKILKINLEISKDKKYNILKINYFLKLTWKNILISY